MSCWRWWPWSWFAAFCFCFCVVAPQQAMAIGPYVVEEVAGQKTVLDQATGLEWQQADDGVARTWQDAIDYCEAIELGGHTDWRLPNIKELLSVVDYSRYNPPIDTTKFQARSLFYWSSTAHVYYADYVWGVYFGPGGGIWFKETYGNNYARCVRGGINGSFDHLNMGGPYAVDGQTVLDQGTGLLWQRDDDGKTRNWQQAKDYCEHLDMAGYTDWRLPEKLELQIIVDYSRYKPAIDTTKFQTRSSDYWSSTPPAKLADYAWVVYFYDGNDFWYTKADYNAYARCVRGEPNWSFNPLAILTFSPASCASTGGTTVTITGIGFGDAQGNGTVTIGGQAAPIVNWSATQIIAVTPAHAAGTVEVTVTTGSGRTVTAPGGFTYQGASEICDGIDNDGDGQIDEGFDQDNDGTPDCNDGCPSDPMKTSAGVCGCGITDTDSDSDGTPDYNDGCPSDPLKIAAGSCGCGVADIDSDGDGTPNCNDTCPNNSPKTAPGVCGCGVADTDSDGDGTPDCNDACPDSNPAAVEICDGIDNNCNGVIDEGCAAANCLTCHGYPPAPLVHTPASTGSLTAGAHAQHIGYYCTTCHEYAGAFGQQLHPSQSLQIKVNMSGGAGTGSDTAQCGENYGPFDANAYFAQKAVIDSGGSYDGSSSITTIITPDDQRWSPDREMTCANIYCHSQGKRLRQGYDLPSFSPSWDGSNVDPQNDGEKCNNCHGNPPSFDSHAYHSSRRFGCELCHAATTTDGRTISDPARHANFAYDVVPAKAFYARRQWHNLSFVYTSTEGGASCSANSCHRYFNYKDEMNWTSRRQEIADAKLSVRQGSCQPPAAGQPLAAETVTVDVRPLCSDCVGPYTCDFDWGDGTVDTNVACTTSHTYADKIPPPHDPTGTVIGAFDITWTIRDSYGVTLSGCNRTTRIQVCPLPNVAPVVNHRLAAGPDPKKYDFCLQDLSIDPDYNLGTHYDPSGVTPGTIRIDWGFSAEQWNDVNEAAIILTDQPSGEVFCHSYPVRGIYTIRHSIRDNHGGQDFVRAPVRRVKVMKDAIQIR